MPAPRSARALAALLALVAALAAPGAARAQETVTAPPDPAAERLFEQTRARVEALRERNHWSARSIDRDVLLEEVANRIEAGADEAQLTTWLDLELPKRLLRFAPLDPELPPRRYALPFDRRVHWIVSQGNSSDPGHRGFEEYALDFAMPEGTEVWAARGGTVARVVDGFHECGLPRREADRSNFVVVLHEDGSFALYDHLSPGIPVVEGQVVAAGDRLGRSGCTGNAASPHLHFQVSARRAATRVHSVAFAFEDGSPAGYVPKVWSLYQNRPPATAPLRVSIAGRALASGQPFPVPDRGPQQLRVEASGPSGTPRDVTRDPGTHYVALTPWSLAVDAGGRITWGADSKTWAALPVDVQRDFAIATILYRDAAGNEGYFDAWLTPPAAGR